MTEHAMLAGKGPYTVAIDPDFALKGERFRAERQLSGGGKEVVYGTFDMVGNAVSEEYGWLAQERRGNELTAKVKRETYERTWGSYINVLFDHENYATTLSGRSEKSIFPSSTLYFFRDNWIVYSTEEVYARKTRALQEHGMFMLAQEAEHKLERLRLEREGLVAQIAAVNRKIGLALGDRAKSTP